jgi:hypothetical protein
VTSRQTLKRCPIPWRYAGAKSRWRRGQRCDAMGPWMMPQLIGRLEGLFERLLNATSQHALLSRSKGRRIVLRALEQGTKAPCSVVFSHFWEWGYCSGELCQCFCERDILLCPVVLSGRLGGELWVRGWPC